MKLFAALEDLESSATDYELACAIEKCLGDAQDEIVGQEPEEEGPEYDAWEEKSEAYDELCDLASSTTCSVQEYDEAYTEFEKEYGKAPKFGTPEYDEWNAAFEDALKGPIEEMTVANSMISDFIMTLNDFEGEYGGLDDLEVITPKELKKQRQDVRIIRILSMLQRTDKDNPMQQTEIVDRLKKEYLTEAERKAVARDLKSLVATKDLNVEKNGKGWYVTDSSFKDYEVKILMDAIGTASFIDYKCSKNIIEKLKTLVSTSTARNVDKTVILDKEIKSRDRDLVSNVQIMLDAIIREKQVSFQMHEDEVLKNCPRTLYRDGHVYQINPFHIVLANGYYYLIGNSVNNNDICHFRLDRILNLHICEDKPRRKVSELPEIKKLSSRTQIANYMRTHVNFYSGSEDIQVAIEGNNSIRGEILKKFGNMVNTMPKPGKRFSATLHIANSESFYWWLAQFGSNITIVNPKKVRDGYVEYLKNTLAQYEK